MKLTILGSGTSTGVPEIGCTCPVCTSADPRDNRLRASSLLHADDATILIDCSPDFRAQILRTSIYEQIDGVLITQEHYDHTGGLDDLRPFCRFSEIPIYSDAYTAAHLRVRMPYCFVDKKYPGVPRIYLQEVEAILGYRIGGRLGYVTDMLTMPDASYEQLQGLDVLVMNALRPQPHSTHQSISEALAAAERIGAKETYFIHMSHHVGLHAEINSQLPPHVHFAYDGMEIDF